jgi:DNA primase
MIPVSVIEDIRSRIDPVEVIGRRVELKKTGTSFSASCPFHADRTPSFRVFPDSKRFKCFGCNARGDVFEFLRRFEGKGFPDAVRELAVEVGVRIAPDSGASGSVPAVQGAGHGLDKACEAAMVHWTERLWGDEGTTARRYLTGRGIQEATARKFRLGFALRAWHDLEQALIARGFTEEMLVGAGLLRRSENADRPTHDRFRGRIVFPLFQGDRRVVGFAGRTLAGGEGTNEPKYLNNPETAIFRKGHVLFGLPEAQAGIRASRRTVVVEGYLDAIVAHQAGLHEVVACGGTVITDQQVALLQRAGCEEILLLFDADAAGLAAPFAAAQTLLRAGITARVARIPGQGPLDPDTFVRAQGLAGLTALLDAATPLTEWLLDQAIAKRTQRLGSRGLSVEQKLLIVRDLRPFVAAMRAGLPRALFEQRIARRLELYIVALRAELGRAEERRGPAHGHGGSAWQG